MRINLFGEKKIVSEEEELRNQVENYNSLNITKSARGLAAIVIGIFSAITIGLYYLDVVPAENLFSLVLYLLLAIFIYKGHRWAIIAVMVMWTFDKGYQLYIGQGGIGLFFWWLQLMSPLASALGVENARRKKANIEQIDDVVPATVAMGGRVAFCSACGTRLQAGASFCQNCGNKIT